MEALISPSDIEKVATDIANFETNSELGIQDKIKILTMTRDYYRDRNLTSVDQWLAGLCDITLGRIREKGFEEN